MSESIERTTHIAAPIDRVFGLLTSPEYLGTVFADDGAELDLRVGGRITMRWAEHGSTSGEVLALDPPTTFAFTWDALAGTQTDVTFTLAEQDGGTQVTVVETGFDRIPLAAEQVAEHREGNVDGWRIQLERLAAHATGAAA